MEHNQLREERLLRTIALLTTLCILSFLTLIGSGWAKGSAQHTETQEDRVIQQMQHDMKQMQGDMGTLKADVETLIRLNEHRMEEERNGRRH